MSYYILIRGSMASGKSTISKRLAKILKAEYISVDAVLEKHKLDKVPPNAPGVPAENFIKADNILLPKVKKLLKKGKIVIFDACFYHKKHILHLIRSLKYPHYAFTLKAPAGECIKRDLKRKKTLGKDSVCAVHWLVSRFDYGIAIKTNKKTINKILNEISKYLPK